MTTNHSVGYVRIDLECANVYLDVKNKQSSKQNKQNKKRIKDVSEEQFLYNFFLFASTWSPTFPFSAKLPILIKKTS